MIARLVRWSVDHAGLVVAATVGLLAIGVFYATRVKFDALPDLTSNQVEPRG